MTPGAELRIPVALAPRAATDEVRGVEGGVLRVRVTAAPVDGAANDALVRLVAKALGVARSNVRVASGAASRRKVVAVRGVAADAIARLWPGLGRESTRSG